MKTIVIRIYRKDFLKLKKRIKPKKDETVADYFERVSLYLEFERDATEYMDKIFHSELCK